MHETYNRMDRAMKLRKTKTVFMIVTDILIWGGLAFFLGMLIKLAPVANTKVPCNQTSIDASGHYTNYNACEGK